MALNIRALFGVGTSATTTTVSVNPSSATLLLASDINRKGFIVYNETGTLYVKFGLLASSSNYSRRLLANEFLEISNYTGTVTAIKASGTTNVQVTSIV